MAPDCLDASAMPKEHASSETIEEGLRQDVLWLLISVYSYVTRRRFEGLGKMSREEFVLDCILLESAARDIVGRLTALDDDTKNNRSFQKLYADMQSEGLDFKRTKDLDAKTKEYRSDELRDGQECVRSEKLRWWTLHYYKKKKNLI